MHQQQQKSRAGMWVLVAVLGPVIAIIVAAIVVAASGSDRTAAEDEFLAHQQSSLSDDEALRDGHAICDMLATGGQAMTVEWLAGVDEFSRAGVVAANPNPISMFDARQIVEAADTYLC